MKKFFALLIMMSAVITAFAVIPGDTPGTPKHRLQWVDCSPMPLGRLDREIHKDIPQLRVIVFMMTRAKNTPSTIALLENLRTLHQGKALIALITPDNLSDAQHLRRLFPDMRLRLAVDMERKLTPEYMSDTIMLFPMAFIMDENGMIRWRGEAVDLPEAIEKIRQNKMDTATQKKLAPMIYTMQQHLRDGNMYKAQAHAMQILAADPGNPSALRLAVFAAESRNRPGEAWNIISGELKKSPDIPRLYFIALDLIIRHEIFRPHLKKLTAEFSARPFPSALRCVFANTLLNQFLFEADAVLGAEKILAATPMPINAIPAQLAQLLAVRGRLKYALGDLKGAEADLAEAVQYLQASGDRDQLQQAQKQLSFYRALIKHQGQKKR